MSISLVVMQPTSFCNLACSYCYLPDRSVKGTMSEEVLAHFFRVMFNSQIAEHCRIVWHAGEPLACGKRFFESALRIQRQYAHYGSKIEHWIQTNGSLINDDWCEFFKENNIRISVSLDGPQEMHDHTRKNRKGFGTHASVVAAIRRLQHWGVTYNALSVITRNSLAKPREYFQSMVDLGVRRVGINIEELNSQSGSSSMVQEDTADFEVLKSEYRSFFSALFQLWKDNHQSFEIREFAQLYRVVNEKLKRGTFARTSEEHSALEILNIKKNGDVSTFAPELIESRDGDKDFFVLGNVKHLSNFESLLATDNFSSIETDVKAGIEKCRASCEYFDFCGGGHLSAKYFENGTLDSAETRYCQLHRKCMTDVVLAGLSAE